MGKADGVPCAYVLSGNKDKFYVGKCSTNKCDERLHSHGIFENMEQCEGRDGAKCSQTGRTCYMQQCKGICGPTMLWTSLGEVAFPSICNYWDKEMSEPEETTEEPKARRRRDRRRRSKKPMTTTKDTSCMGKADGVPCAYVLSGNKDKFYVGKCSTNKCDERLHSHGIFENMEQCE